MLKAEFIRGTLLKKEILPAFILIVNAFSWYFPLYVFFDSTLNKIGIGYTEVTIIFGAHYMAVVLFAIIGTTLVGKIISRNTLLSIWMFLGTIFSAFMVFLNSNNLVAVYLVPILMGIALGLGFPCCLAYFADSVNAENRGRVGGVMLFAAHLGMLLIGFLNNILGFEENVIIFTFWRAMGFFAFQFLKGKNSNIEKETIDTIDTSYKLLISEKSFILYMVPWIMFCLVNFFVGPLQQHHWGIEASNTVSTAEFGIASIATLIGGYFADSVGRKRLVILGYILLGIGYAMLSIFPSNQISIGIYAVFDGIAWGLFALIFFTTIWGDLSGNKAKEKYYLLGELPFLISSYISIIVAPYAAIIPISASFSLASFFLFLAVVPLMYAPETLPEKKIRERELKGYINKAKKVKEKYT